MDFIVWELGMILCADDSAWTWWKTNCAPLLLYKVQRLIYSILKQHAWILLSLILTLSLGVPGLAYITAPS